MIPRRRERDSDVVGEEGGGISTGMPLMQVTRL